MTGSLTQLQLALADVVATGDGRLDPTPEANDVTAGWAGFAVFIGLILAVVVIAFFLTRQLRRAQAAKEAGVFGDDVADADADADAESGQDSDQQS